MLCYRCGSHVPDGSEVCGSCGQRFDAALRGKTGTFQRRKLSEAESAGVKVGEVLAGRYEIRSIVGQGPVGAVLRALDKEVDVEIGLKLIAPRLLQSPDERAEFVKLLKQAKKLAHPNVMRIYEIGSLDEEGTPAQRPFFTMQLLDGLTLRRVIDLRREKNQLFTLREVEPILAQVALALDHARSFGPHGDLKPDNIVVLPDLLKVTDFGLAPAMPRAPFVAAQRARKADVYLSPEFLAGRSIDARTDVYSVGVILGEMVGGVLPSGGQVAELRATNPDLPAGIEGLYRRAVNQNTEARFATAGDLAAELLALAETTAPPLPRPPGAAPSAPPPAAPVRAKAKPAPPPPPPQDSGSFEAKTEVDEVKQPAAKAPPPPPAKSPASSPAEKVPTPPPPAEIDESTARVERRQAETTRNARPAKGPARDPGAIPIEAPAQRRPRPPPPPPPAATERTGGRWVAVAAVALFALGASVYGGWQALAIWQTKEEARLKVQLQREMDQKLRAAQAAAVAAVVADAGASVADAGAAASAAVDAGPRVAVAPPPPVKPVKSAVEPTGVVAPSGPAATSAIEPAAMRRPPPEHPAPSSGERAATCPSGMRYVRGSAFHLGTSSSDDLGNFGDRPERRVALKGYCIDVYEYPDRPEERPLASVSYSGAEAACAAEGKRLCTEEEWEKACKGPDNLRFPYGQAFSARACNGGKSGIVLAGTTPGCKSGYGVFDMSGNVAEWTSTRFQPGTSDRTVKGGSYLRPDYDLRCSARQNKPPGSRSSDLGFRCCANPG